MQKVPYPSKLETISVGFHWEDGFSFPPEFKVRLKERFPDWDELHEYVEREDLGAWSLLWLYERKIRKIKPKEILAAEAAGTLNEIPDRVRAAMELKKFIEDLEKEFFPEQVAARERRRQEALDSWL